MMTMLPNSGNPILDAVLALKPWKAMPYAELLAALDEKNPLAGGLLRSLTNDDIPDRGTYSLDALAKVFELPEETGRREIYDALCLIEEHEIFEDIRGNYRLRGRPLQVVSRMWDEGEDAPHLVTIWVSANSEGRFRDCVRGPLEASR